MMRKKIFVDFKNLLLLLLMLIYKKPASCFVLIFDLIRKFYQFEFYLTYIELLLGWTILISICYQIHHLITKIFLMIFFDNKKMW